jgi:hypothetical protein
MWFWIGKSGCTDPLPAQRDHQQILLLAQRDHQRLDVLIHCRLALAHLLNWHFFVPVVSYVSLPKPKTDALVGAGTCSGSCCSSTSTWCTSTSISPRWLVWLGTSPGETLLLFRCMEMRQWSVCFDGSRWGYNRTLYIAKHKSSIHISLCLFSASTKWAQKTRLIKIS